jgi:hypothetical protein
LINIRRETVTPSEDFQMPENVAAKKADVEKIKVNEAEGPSGSYRFRRALGPTV